MPKHDINKLKEAANRYGWDNLISRITGFNPASYAGKSHHPCPKCGGKDRFRYFTDGSGRAFCNQCFNDKNSDGIATIKWLMGWSYAQTLDAIAEVLGIGQGKKKDPEKNLKFLEWKKHILLPWARMRLEKFQGQADDDSIANLVEAANSLGAKLAIYRKRYQVIAFPIRKANGLDQVVGWLIESTDSNKLPIFGKQKKPIDWQKRKIVSGSGRGIICRDQDLINSPGMIKVEGISDLITLAASGIEDDTFIFTNPFGAGEDPRKIPGLSKLIAERDVVIIHDCDAAGREGAAKWTAYCAKHAKSARDVKLPFPIAKSHGKDLSDYLLGDGKTLDDLMSLVSATEAASSDVEADPDFDPYNPFLIAQANIDSYWAKKRRVLKYWRQEWYQWKDNKYQQINARELRAKVRMFIFDEFKRIHLAELEESEKETRQVKHVTESVVTNVVAAMESLCYIPDEVEMNSWLGQDGEEPRRYLALNNGILDIDAFVEGRNDSKILLPHDPRWFSTTKIPCDLDPVAECPTWDQFLKTSIGNIEVEEFLREWVGYCLLPDVSQQRFLVLEGEGANGKSAFIAGMEAIVGEEAAAHIPLENFADRFSLATTIGKLINVSPDVGELDKVAEGHLKSFVAGEKLYFDRKGLSGVQAYPTARLTMACNMRPRFSDRSSGLWRRMILVRFEHIIDEDQRIMNLDKPWWWTQSGELSGMLNWALYGAYNYIKRGSLKIPQCCVDEIEEYKLESNPVLQFIHDWMEEFEAIDNRDGDSSRDIYEKYRIWCSEHGYRPLSSSSLGKEFKRKFPNVKIRRIRDGNSRIHIYPGLRCTYEIARFDTSSRGF